MTWTVIDFVLERGTNPVKEFIREVDEPTQNKILKAIDILRIYGTTTPMPFNKHISKTIGELRTSGKLSIRVLYGKSGRTLVLLHAFKKKTNQLPSKELKLAERRFAKYLSNRD